MTSPQPMHELSLLSDQSLVVRVHDALRSSIVPWLPLHATAADDARVRQAGAEIDVDLGAGETIGSSSEGSDAPLLLRLGGASAIDVGPDDVVLEGSGAVRGRIALAAMRATITVHDPALVSTLDARAGGELYSMLTLAAAFLVGRLGGALVHAGSVVDPEGRAWLLVGDTHAGKTTTCVSLVDAGWRFLADDQVVLRAGESGAIGVEGWPRHAHLDEGWSDGAVTGTRAAVDLRRRWGDRWLARAPLGGLLFPAVQADAPTAVTPAHAATALAGLVRQSPWLMADRSAAPTVLALLREAAARPAFALTLGRDSYARGDVLAERLAPLR